MKRKVKFIVILLSFMLVTGTLFGCNGSAPQSDGTQTETPQAGTPQQADTSAPEGKTLTLMGPTDWIDGPFEKVIQGYEEKTGNKIEIIILPTENYWDVMSTNIATGNLADIMCSFPDLGRLSQFIPEDNLVDLSNEEFVDHLADGVVNDFFFNYKGKIYGAPLQGVSPFLPYYNKDVFNKFNINVPTNFEEFVQSCETLKANGIVPIFEAGADAWPMEIFPDTLQAYVTAAQPDLIKRLNNNTTKMADVPELVHTFEVYKDFYDKGYFQQDVLAGTYEQQLEALATGKCGYIFSAPVCINQLLESYPEAKDKLGCFVMVPVNGGPKVVCASVNTCIVINRNSPNVEDALEFLRYFTSPEVLGPYYTELEHISPYTNVDYEFNPLYNEVMEVMQTNGAQPIFPNALDPIIGFEGVKAQQDLLQGIIDAKGAFQRLDEYRAAAGKDAGKEGW